MSENQTILTAKDFKSDQEVRWCPGCGDHAIMNAIQRALPDLGYKKKILLLFRVLAVHRVSHII